MSNKEALMLSVGMLACTVWAVWNFFYLPAIVTPKITSILSLLVFLSYVYLCVYEFRIGTHPLFFVLSSLAFVTIFLTQFALIYNHFGLISSDNCVIYDKLDCLYFSIITFTTVGYGDFRPTHDGRLFAGVEALTGVMFFSLFISTFISTLIHTTNTRPGNE